MSKSFDPCWLDRKLLKDWPFESIEVNANEVYAETLIAEFKYFKASANDGNRKLIVQTVENDNIHADGFLIEERDHSTYIQANQAEGLIYGFYYLVRQYQISKNPDQLDYFLSNPSNQIRMINHWDNFDGSVERGYAGRSIFFEDNAFSYDPVRIKHYARLLASVGINALTINNVNVHKEESYFVTDKYLTQVAALANIFEAYGLTLYLSVNYASPIEVAGLDTADPLDSRVQEFWKETFDRVYTYIPNFGGVVVKADSENRPGPFTYNRTHVDGANMLAAALKPHSGKVFWRCFVYNHKQDWRDRKTDRARAAYDHFQQFNGQFADNVILQIKNGPMDFQVREAVSPLFGAINQTNQALEFQITQEYTGQQKHIFYLLPMWKEILDFDTYAEGAGSTIQTILNTHYKTDTLKGIVTAVVNVGRDDNWTGHKFAQANLYGYGRLIWNSKLSPEEILSEWLTINFELSKEKTEIIQEILLSSWATYEKYTSPLGIGWMVKPHYHYDPDINGYEYDLWGTYHFSDRNGLGVDRTVKTGTGYTRQYFKENFEKYEDVETCPEELLLFFHHLSYTYELKSGKTIIQHIYDTHFEGYEEVEQNIEKWQLFESEVSTEVFENVNDRLKEQLRSAREWRDQINTYYFRMSGIEDDHGRTIYR